jgi:hypothetical protein
VRNLLKFFNVDEIHALTGPDGLPSAEAIRRFARRPEKFLSQVKELTTRFSKPMDQIARAFENLAKARTDKTAVMSVLNGFTSKADTATLGSLLDAMAAGFVGRVARIRGGPAPGSEWVRDVLADHGVDQHQLWRRLAAEGAPMKLNPSGDMVRKMR